MNDKPGDGAFIEGVPSSAAVADQALFVVLALAALGAALISIFGDKSGYGGVTIACSLLGLAPWALLAGGVGIRVGVVAVTTLALGAAIVLVDRNPGGMFPVMVAVVYVAAQIDRHSGVVAAVATAAAMPIALAVLEGNSHETGLVYFAGGVGISWLAGHLIRRQHRLVVALYDASAQLSMRAATDERSRIAREIHDIVAHSLTITLLNIGGARRALRSDPTKAEAALERAETIGRESLEAVRHTVGLLRGADSLAPATSEPLPTLHDLPALVSRYREAGLAVSSKVDVEPGRVDDRAALTAYRMVQEGLANVLRHAPGAACSVEVSMSADQLRVRVENGKPVGAAAPSPPVGRATGNGLRGMSERVRAHGGTLHTATTEQGGFLIQTLLPIGAAEGITT